MKVCIWCAPSCSNMDGNGKHRNNAKNMTNTYNTFMHSHIWFCIYVKSQISKVKFTTADAAVVHALLAAKVFHDDCKIFDKIHVG